VYTEIMHTVHPKRIFPLNNRPAGEGPVVYWMSRDQRVRDNWVLLYAQELALARKRSLVVFFGLSPSFVGATWRQYSFMLAGLREVERDLRKLGIGFRIVAGDPGEEIVRFADSVGAGTVVTDFSPLRMHRMWKDAAAKRLAVSLVEVDAHNVVPCREASPKREYAARTIRPKIHRLLPEYLTDFPRMKKHPFAFDSALPETDWEALRATISVDESVEEISSIVPGERAGQKVMKDFLENRIKRYDRDRNDPNAGGISGLSPYLHFGQIAPQRVAYEAAKRHGAGADAFLEELVIRRELAENYCFYEPQYDSVDAFPEWARRTLDAHRGDEREYIYSRDEFETGKTHDPLWNAAERQLVETGRLHGYVRMYWAKKILEWSASPEEAMAIAIYLNDRYALDGRDPNGYVGIAWSIGGVHDRPWFNRPVFGTIRYMAISGMKKKFDVEQYIESHRNPE
jgi:deoxyribodipyrimidine photo-lyase